MTIEVQFYAVIRERLGKEKDAFDLPEGAPVRALREAVAARYPELSELLRRTMVAVNHEYSRDTEVIPHGAAVALIPPIAGGATLLSENPLDVGELAQQVVWPGAGGLVTFTGIVRNESRGRQVSVLEYEAYPEMAEHKLREVIEEVVRQYPEVRCALRHRVGRLEIGEAAVAIAVAAPHRREAFAACELAIDYLKRTVPLWKRETGDDGTSWVEECVPEAKG